MFEIMTDAQNWNNGPVSLPGRGGKLGKVTTHAMASGGVQNQCSRRELQMMSRKVAPNTQGAVTSPVKYDPRSPFVKTDSIVHKFSV